MLARSSKIVKTQHLAPSAPQVSAERIVLALSAGQNPTACKINPSCNNCSNSLIKEITMRSTVASRTHERIEARIERVQQFYTDLGAIASAPTAGIVVRADLVNFFEALKVPQVFGAVVEEFGRDYQEFEGGKDGKRLVADADSATDFSNLHPFEARIRDGRTAIYVKAERSMQLGNPSKSDSYDYYLNIPTNPDDMGLDDKSQIGAQAFAMRRGLWERGDQHNYYGWRKDSKNNLPIIPALVATLAAKELIVVTESHMGELMPMVSGYAALDALSRLQS